MSERDSPYLGDTIAIYGPVGPNSTQAFSVQIDEGPSSVFNANNKFYRSQQILFLIGELGRGSHTLRLMLPSPATGELAIDYANAYTAPSLGGRSVLL